MSGSSGGGYIPQESTKFDCDSSSISSNVSTIDLNVLGRHKLGDQLIVTIGDNECLLLEDGNGEILGAILHINNSDIIKCIKKGNTYQAEITRINTPVCTVQIKRKLL